MLQFLIWPFSSGKPLTKEEFKKVKDVIKYQRNADTDKAVSRAKKDERTVRRSLKKISMRIKEAAEILGELNQAAVQKKPDLIKGKNWVKWQGELKKLEKLKVYISEYGAVISKIL